MNTENMTTLRNALANALAMKKGLPLTDCLRKSFDVDAVGFNMQSWIAPKYDDVIDHVDNCNTVACLSGWCYILQDDPSNTAGKWLGLAPDEAERLFCPKFPAYYGSKYWRHITAQEAIDALDLCIKLDHVPNNVWDKAWQRIKHEHNVPEHAERHLFV